MSLLKTSRYFKRGLHIPELPQYSPELGGSNRTPLPSLEGDNRGPKLSDSSSEEGWKTGYEIGYLDGYRGFGKAPLPDPDYERGYFDGQLARKQSNLEGRNHSPLPGASGESHVPNLSGNNGDRQLPGASGESQVPNLSGNNGYRPLPGESGESQLPDLSGNNGDRQLPGESGETTCQI